MAYNLTAQSLSLCMHGALKNPVSHVATNSPFFFLERERMENISILFVSAENIFCLAFPSTNYYEIVLPAGMCHREHPSIIQEITHVIRRIILDPEISFASAFNRWATIFLNGIIIAYLHRNTRESRIGRGGQSEGLR